MSPFLTLSCPTSTFVDFTLSNARQFYSSMGNPLGRKGLNTTSSKTYVPIFKLWKETNLTNFYFDRVELFFVVTSAYFATYCLRKICGVTWKDKIPNTEILPHCNITSVESIIMASQLRWSGHVARIRDAGVPKALTFELLEEDRRSRGGQRKRYKDVLKTTMKVCNIDPATSEDRGSEPGKMA